MIHSNEPIHLESKQVSVFMNESLTQMIHSNEPIHLESKQVPLFMNESLNHSFKWFIQTNRFI